jgi:hypothetical protein
MRSQFAGLAQLVEHQLPKLRVASSNLVSRSEVEVAVFWEKHHACRKRGGSGRHVAFVPRKSRAAPDDA